MQTNTIKGELVSSPRFKKMIVSGMLVIAMIMMYLFTLQGRMSGMIGVSSKMFTLLIFAMLLFNIIPSGWGCDLYTNGVQRVARWQPKKFAAWEDLVEIKIQRRPHYQDKDHALPFSVRLTDRSGDVYIFRYQSRQGLLHVWNLILETNPQLSSITFNELGQLDW